MRQLCETLTPEIITGDNVHYTPACREYPQIMLTAPKELFGQNPIRVEIRQEAGDEN